MLPKDPTYTLHFGRQHTHTFLLILPGPALIMPFFHSYFGLFPSPKSSPTIPAYPGLL